MNLQPHEVSNDLAGYAIGIYGGTGLGKTTSALQAPQALLIAAEKG